MPPSKGRRDLSITLGRRRVRPQRENEDGRLARRVAGLMRAASGGTRRGATRAGAARVLWGRRAGGATAQHQQRSTVKVSYSRSGGGRNAPWGAHGSYIQRKGSGEDGGRPRGFDARGEGIDLQSTLKGWESAGDALLWKIIVSPERGAELDLEAHARALMQRVEKDLATTLTWVAAVHHDTDQPHVHIALRGVRDDGGELHIERAYIQREIRAHSQDLATRELGPRTREEIEAEHERLRRSLGVTWIDRRLLDLAQPGGDGALELDSAALGPAERSRLEFLEEVGLATRTTRTRWTVHAELREGLLRTRAVQDAQALLADHRTSLSTPTAPARWIAREGPSHAVRVRVVDASADRAVVLLESTNGTAYLLTKDDASLTRSTERRHLRTDDVLLLQRDGSRLHLTLEGTRSQLAKSSQRALAWDLDAAHPSTDAPALRGFAAEWHQAQDERRRLFADRGLAADGVSSEEHARRLNALRELEQRDLPRLRGHATTASPTVDAIRGTVARYTTSRSGRTSVHLYVPDASGDVRTFSIPVQNTAAPVGAAVIARSTTDAADSRRRAWVLEREQARVRTRERE